MSKTEGPKGGDYEVGYGKPPKHSRWVPGQSGFKGRKKKPAETQAEIIARQRDELVIVNGNPMTKFELAVASTVNQTIKSGKPRDLKILFDLLEKHGAMSKGNWAAEMTANADKTMQKIGQIVERTLNIDPKDAAMLDKLNAEEAMLVMSCSHCNDALRRRWADPEYKALTERYHATRIHDELLNGERKREMSSIRPLPKLEI